MSQSLKQSSLLILIYLILNLCAAITLQALSFRLDLKEFNGPWIWGLMPGVLYWVTCQVNNGRYRRWLLPAFRISFWTLIVLSGFIRDKRMEYEDFLYANNAGFLWWELLKLKTTGLSDINPVLELVFEDILLIGIVEFALIRLVNVIVPWRQFNLKYQQ